MRLLLDDSLDNGGSFFRSNDLLIVIGDNLDLTEFVLKCNGFDLNVFLVLFFFLFNIVDNDLWSSKILSHCHHFSLMLLGFNNQGVGLNQSIGCHCSWNNRSWAKIELSISWNDLSKINKLLGLKSMDIDLDRFLRFGENWEDWGCDRCLSVWDQNDFTGSSIGLEHNLTYNSIVHNQNGIFFS